MDMNKMLEDADKLIKQSENFLQESYKREEVINKYFSFFEEDKSLDVKVQAFANISYNEGVDLDKKLVDYFTQTGKEINKENLIDAISAINQINRINYNRNSTFPLTPDSTFPLTPENINQAISIQKGKQQEQITQSAQPKKESGYKIFECFKVKSRPQSAPQKNTASLDSIQKQNTKKEVQTQSKLQQVKVSFSKKFRNISSALSKTFSSGRSISTSNITTTRNKDMSSKPLSTSNVQGQGRNR